jgi:hypothetical protein
MIKLWALCKALLLALVASTALGQTPIEEVGPYSDLAAQGKVATSVRSLEALYKSIQSK